MNVFQAHDTADICVLKMPHYPNHPSICILTYFTAIEFIRCL